MVLLICAILYFIGLTAGRLAWQVGWIGCDFPGWLWLVPVVLLPLTPLLNRLQPQPAVPMRWPASAGFAPIRNGRSAAWSERCCSVSWPALPAMPPIR